jgi:hypothetical protein
VSAPKRRPLNLAALGAAAIPQPDPVHEANRTKATLAVAPSPVTASASKRPPSREGLVQIQGYYPPETRRRLKVLSAKMDKSQEALVGLALEYLFEKHDR